MDSNLIEPESVDISQLLGVNVASFSSDSKSSGAVLKPPTVPPVANRRPSKTLAKASKTSKPVTGSSDPDLTLPLAEVPAAHWECRGTETSRDRARRCVPWLLRFQMCTSSHSNRAWSEAERRVADRAGPEIASAATLWANFFSHCRDAQITLERWPCNEPFPGAKGWSINDVSSGGISLMFTYMVSKNEMRELAPRLVSWSEGKLHFLHFRSIF